MKLKRLDTPEGRCYVYTVDPLKSYEDGGFILMPSVTTILGSKPNAHLANLEEKMGKEELARVGKRAARRGTTMHAFLENFFICLKKTGDHEKSLMYTQKKTVQDLLSEDFEQDEINRGRDLFYNYLYEGYLDRVKNVIFTERFIWSLTNLFAGTADMGFAEDGKVIVADFKSASGLREGDTVVKYELQLAAYAIAYKEIYTQEVHHAELWISHPMGIQEVILEGDRMEQRKLEFIELTQEYHKNWNPHEIANKYYKVA